MTEIRALLAGMNAPQQHAVEHSGGPLLILAGAGSGKTRVLTHRIAYKLATGQVRPHEVLAITFTNKAAAEMRERVRALTGERGQRLWVMTFHAACARILRRDGAEIGYTANFSIYDQGDSRRLIKRILSERTSSSAEPADDESPRHIQSRISHAKNRMLTRAQWLAENGDSSQNVALADVWEAYERELKRMDALDFDDLLLETIRLLSQHPTIRDRYRRRFQQILVDEYQDTNQAQYQLLQLLLGEHRNLTAVGDIDQSIYAFRSADIRNILDFETDFPDATIIKLEQNYRSTQTILDAANAVIDHNTSRRPKRLWTNKGAGDPIQIHQLASGDHEADHITTIVANCLNAGNNLNDLAVLYRTNAQSRLIEQALMHAGIPYQIAGGLRFYDRAEIKDALGYLRVLANPRDDDALTRIINTPKRGIGPATVNHLQVGAAGSGKTLLDTARTIITGMTAKRPNYASVLVTFIQLIDGLAAFHQETPGVAPLLQEILTRTGLLPAETAEDDQANGRRENLLELINVAASYDQEQRGAATITGFLEQTSLSTDTDDLDASEQLTLMTLHASKGLEYPIIILAGLEERLFPHDRALQEGPDGIEEERRLAYVGITRAQRQLHITYARERAVYGRREDAHPSRFLLEIPDNLYRHQEYEHTDQTLARYFHPEHPPTMLQTPDIPQLFPTADLATTEAARQSHVPASATASAGDHPYQPGVPVIHPSLGEGTVLETDGDRLTLSFPSRPGKPVRMFAGKAPLELATA